MKPYFYLTPVVLLLIGTIPSSWAQQETMFSDMPIEFIIDIVHDFDQTFSFKANFFDSESNSLIQPSTNVMLIDPNGSIIFEELTSDEIIISYIPDITGEYKIKLQISENQENDYDWSSIFLDTTIETTQKIVSPAGTSLNSYLKTVAHMDYSVADPEYPAKDNEVTKIIFPKGSYKLQTPDRYNAKLIAAKIPLSSLKENYDEKIRLEQKAQTFVSLSDEELLEEYVESFDQFKNIAEMFDESSVLDWLVQEIPKLDNKINSLESYPEIKNQLLEKTKFALDEIKKSENLIQAADLQGIEDTLVNVQNILESMKDILKEKSSIVGEDVKSLQEEIDRILDGSKKRDIDVLSLVLQESSFDFFNLQWEESTERMERIGLIAIEIENRGYKFGTFLYFEPPTGMIMGTVIFTPELNKLEEELETAIIPKWFKQASEFWTHGRISDTEFYNALKFLVSNERIKIPDSYQNILEELEESEEGLDFKVFTSLWLNDTFSDNVYALGIQELLSNSEIESSEKYLSGTLELADYSINMEVYN